MPPHLSHQGGRPRPCPPRGHPTRSVQCWREPWRRRGPGSVSGHGSLRCVQPGRSRATLSPRARLDRLAARGRGRSRRPAGRCKRMSAAANGASAASHPSNTRQSTGPHTRPDRCHLSRAADPACRMELHVSPSVDDQFADLLDELIVGLVSPGGVARRRQHGRHE